MGAQLAKYFDQAKAKGGVQAQVKLAMLTKMSQSQAQATEDSPDNIAKFEDAMKQL